MFEVSLGDDGAVLRPLEPWQAEEFYTHIERGREFIGRYTGLADKVPDLDGAKAYLRGYADKAAADQGRIYGIWLDGTLVGGVLIRTMDVERGKAEVGCWLEPTVVGKGLVTRAQRKLIDWIVHERGLHRVEWVASAQNDASTAVARRLGMRREAVLRGEFMHRGERHDTEIWAVLADEWRASGESPG